MSQSMHLFLNVIFIGYCIASVAYLSLMFTQSVGLTNVGKRVLIVTFVLHTIFLVARIKADYDNMHYWYAPVANIFEHVVSLSWGLTLVYLISEARTKFKALGMVVVPLINLLMGWATFRLEQSIIPPPPALRSYWINIHVPMSLGAYGAFTIAFAIAIFYFLKQREEGSRISASTPFNPLPEKSRGVGVMERMASPNSGVMTLVPSTEILDKMMYRTVVVGFGFLTALIMLGAVWAEESWGKYWGWDPKETAALITWLVYAVYLHGRFTWGAQKRSTMAVLCIVGFLAAIFTYLGVGFLLPGLHSYLKPS